VLLTLLRSRACPHIPVRVFAGVRLTRVVALATVLLAPVPAFAVYGSTSEILWGSPYRFWYE
jgi:hypothetical protein